MSSEVKVPTLGESVTEATIGEWLKQPGDPVKLDEPVASLETDKVAVEVPSPVAGIMGEHKAAIGDTVEVGAVIALIEADVPAAGPAEVREVEKAPPSSPAPSPAPAPAPAPSPAAAAEASDASLTLSPAVRRAVLEHGIDPSAVRGTGKDGRLTKEDVLAAAKARETGPDASASAPAPADGAPFAPAGERRTERVKMTRLRQTVARRLKQAQETAALLTTFNDVDMSAVIEARNRYKDLFEKKHGVRLGFMSFFAKASVLALKDIPAVNAQIEGEEIVYHDFVDISVAVRAPNGLVVPLVRGEGGTFTISNGGVFGSLMSTPIINPPQSAVLGLHRIEDRAVVVNGEIVIRPMMYIALSYDHRLIDGREAVTALKIIKEAIEDPTRLLIDL